jgi:hypothetical protein
MPEAVLARAGCGGMSGTGSSGVLEWELCSVFVDDLRVHRVDFGSSCSGGWPSAGALGAISWSELVGGPGVAGGVFVGVCDMEDAPDRERFAHLTGTSSIG